jgi:hypothetical protein
MKMITVDLRAEAAAEARRLSAARGWLRDGDQRALLHLQGGGAWISFARRARIRRALEGRLCLVWLVSFEDAAGRSVESRLVPMLIESAADIRWLLADPASNAAIRSRIEIDCRIWREEAVRIAGAFATARLSREREIAERPSRSSAASQPGLFDRRTDRSREGQAGVVAAGQEAMLERRRAAEGAAAIALSPARLLLVLVPQPC